jgi:hypothetical protein
MNFFTLDLYHRFNSPDVDEAVRADAEWENAIVEYKKSLQTYRDELPPGAKKLAEEINLHDAEILGISLDNIANMFSYHWIQSNTRVPIQMSYPIISNIASYLMILLKNAEQISVVLYSLWAQPVRPIPPVRPFPSTNDRLYWLYDEITPEPKLTRHFWHSILLSDETTLEIPFIDCVYHSFQAEGERKLEG